MKKTILLGTIVAFAMVAQAQKKAPIKDSIICDETHMIWMPNSIKVTTENERIYDRMFKEMRQYIHTVSIDMDYTYPRFVVVFKLRYEDELYLFFNRLEADPVYAKKKQ
jgi:hypothetical protein